MFVGVSGGNVLSPSVQVFQAAGSATLDPPTREAEELSWVLGPGPVTCAAVDDGRDIPTFMRGRNNYIEANSRSTRDASDRRRQCMQCVGIQHSVGRLASCRTCLESAREVSGRATRFTFSKSWAKTAAPTEPCKRGLHDPSSWHPRCV